MHINAWIGPLQDDGWIKATLVAWGLAPLRLLYTDNAMFTPLITDSAAHVQSHLLFLAKGIVVDMSIIDGWSRSRPRSTPR